jgi:2-iminoacetate synthase ThiH
MAKKEEVDPALKRWVTAHMPEKGEPAPEKADTSYTIYVSKSEAERIAKCQREFGTTRQEVLRRLVQAGLKQLGVATGWWTDE